LTYTQALILLGILEEERDEFIAEHDVGKRQSFVMNASAFSSMAVARNSASGVLNP